MVVGPPKRRKTVGALAVYLLLVARVTLWPTDAYGDTLDVVRTVLSWLSDRGLPVTYAGVEAVSNVLMFVPFGVLVGLLVRRSWVVVLLGCATSTAIELAQLAFLPTRVPTVQDVVMNTLGAALGLAGLRWWAHRAAGRVPRQEDPAPAGAADVSR
ncbi:VanZ family protein [Cellulomonas sp. URHB0016]